MNTDVLEVVWTGGLWRDYWQPVSRPSDAALEAWKRGCPDSMVKSRKRIAQHRGPVERGVDVERKILIMLSERGPLTAKQLFHDKAGRRWAVGKAVTRLRDEGRIAAVGREPPRAPMTGNRAVLYGLVNR